MNNRLLYAEDDDTVRNAVSQVLRHLGWEVTTAAHGAEALGKLGETEFDVVLTDHHMPVANGLALVEGLRNHGFSGRIFVISGALSPVDEERYQRLGVDGIASKPVAITDLHALLGATRKKVA